MSVTCLTVQDPNMGSQGHFTHLISSSLHNTSVLHSHNDVKNAQKWAILYTYVHRKIN